MPKSKTRRIFISATGQNDGKTVVSLGLIYALQERFKRIGFIKPVGQRYLIEKNEKVDEDSVLIEKACGIKCPIKDMSPVAIEKGFTRNYILTGQSKGLVRRIKSSFKAVAKDKDLVIIEGTGHAGVGSVFDLSNATVAKMLSSKVIIVSSGGIGRPIDEIMLNKALFDKEGVQIAGVIINKVKPEKYNQINRIVRAGLKRKGLKTLGVIPYRELLSEPTIRQVLEELNFELIVSGGSLETSVDKILVGAMAPHDALKYFSDRSLIITPGDREDMILAVTGFQADKQNDGVRIAGIVLTGGIKPHKSVVDLVKKAKIPLLLAKGDTYSVASKVHDLTVKIRAEDAGKMKIIRDLIEKYVDIKTLLRQL
ncbi:MAG: AAA family ATPase [Candidatus Omnitrophota bacterium]|nr:MAG: AAA family ATPase [Candidatus Omnitrophota bacterium]